MTMKSQNIRSAMLTFKFFTTKRLSCSNSTLLLSKRVGEQFQMYTHFFNVALVSCHFQAGSRKQRCRLRYGREQVQLNQSIYVFTCQIFSSLFYFVEVISMSTIRLMLSSNLTTTSNQFTENRIKANNLQRMCKAIEPSIEPD